MSNSIAVCGYSTQEQNISKTYSRTYALYFDGISSENNLSSPSTQIKQDMEFKNLKLELTSNQIFVNITNVNRI